MTNVRYGPPPSCVARIDARWTLLAQFPQRGHPRLLLVRVHDVLKEIIAVMRQAGGGAHGDRLRGLVLVLWHPACGSARRST